MKTLIPLMFLLTLVTACASGLGKAELDAEVRRLCAIDGGVRVYETVMLPAEMFNQWGQINFYRPDQGENALGSEYIFRVDRHYYRSGEQNLIRHRYQIILRSSGKLMAETVSYGRGGGDVPGPWHPSSFTCPDVGVAGPNALLKAVFIQRNNGRGK